MSDYDPDYNDRNQREATPEDAAFTVTSIFTEHLEMELTCSDPDHDHTGEIMKSLLVQFFGEGGSIGYVILTPVMAAAINAAAATFIVEVAGLNTTNTVLTDDSINNFLQGDH